MRIKLHQDMLYDVALSRNLVRKTREKDDSCSAGDVWISFEDLLDDLLPEFKTGCTEAHCQHKAQGCLVASVASDCAYPFDSMCIARKHSFFSKCMPWK